MSRLAIIDWGIGGISIVKLIKQTFGDVSITYFSDTGVTPYGKMVRHELVARLDKVISDLMSRGVTHLVVGCNAASTAIPDLDATAIQIEGVIANAVAKTLSLKPRRLGLIGGRRTVLSGIYRRAFAAGGIKVRQRVAQPLSGLIESGDVSSDALRAECKRILTPLKNSSHILLACTHYPAIQPILRDLVSTETAFIDPAEPLVDALKKWQLAPGGNDLYMTTGNPRNMKQAAYKAFQWDIDKIQKSSL